MGPLVDTITGMSNKCVKSQDPQTFEKLGQVIY